MTKERKLCGVLRKCSGLEVASVTTYSSLASTCHITSIYHNRIRKDALPTSPEWGRVPRASHYCMKFTFWVLGTLRFHPHFDKQSIAAAAAAAAAKSLHSCPTLCDPIDGSTLGSSAPGILQAKILKMVAISFSNAWKWRVKVKLLSHARLLS